jgi:hypothetical protein
MDAHPPQNIVDRIADPEIRKQYGSTKEERAEKYTARLERELHGQFSGFLHRHKDKIALVHHTNPAKRTRATVGEPDYVIHFMSGQTLFIEIKVGKNKLSPEQEEITDRLREAGYKVLITGDYAEAIRIAQSLF